ncbi:MAG: hypothetical protein H0Z34_12510 [Brevibacillus sp.]|nr:hypothetical protein [Brevibacillus sp.]
MSELTCVVIGGGYAGIHAIKAIQKALRETSNAKRFRLILVDKQPYHLRKVLLFKPVVKDVDITIPWTNLFPDGITFVQGTVTTIESREKRLRYQDAEGQERLSFSCNALHR